MSEIDWIEVQHFRNFREKKIPLSSSINFLCGPNGSGKTSLMEAIWLLSSGTSFRTKRLDELIQTLSDTTEEVETQLMLDRIKFLSVSAAASKHAKDQAGSLTHIQFIRRDGKNHYYFAHNQQPNVINQAKALPIILILPDNLSLISTTPKARRQKINWGCFYHFPLYGNIYGRFVRALKQRNSALKIRQSIENIRHWNATLARESRFVSQCQEQYVRLLEKHFQEALSHMMHGVVIKNISFGYLNTVSKLPTDELPESFWLQAYNDSMERDLKEGYTHLGPQRADLLIKANGRPLFSILSRGQSKIATSALLLSQATLLYEEQGVSPIILIDDFSSELDYTHRYRFIDYLLKKVKCQVVLSAVDQGLLPTQFWDQADVINLSA